MKVYEYARFKRCMEWYAVDPGFREMMKTAPFLGVSMIGYADVLDADLTYEAIRGIFFRDVEWSSLSQNPYYRAFTGKDKEVSQWIVNSHKREAFSDSQTFYYLDTVRNRCRMEHAGLRQNPMIYYYPFAIELTSGCSVQCPFCAFEPKMLKGALPYNEENSREFKRLLVYLKERYGEIAGLCPCYLSTEPFDNPDYEKFVEDYYSVLGTIPQTTTATAEKNASRIKKMMAHYGYETLRKFAAFRFSIRTIEQYKKIIEQFSPEELLDVEVICNNPESINAYSDSGKVTRNRNVKSEKKRKYSIDCVSGVRINLADRFVEYIEPEIPDEEFTRGYKVFERVYFEDTTELIEQIERLSNTYSIGLLPMNRRLELNRNITLEENQDGYVFCGDEISFELGKKPAVMTIVESMNSPWIMSEVLEKIPDMNEREEVVQYIGSLYQRGYIRLSTDSVGY